MKYNIILAGILCTNLAVAGDTYKTAWDFYSYNTKTRMITAYPVSYEGPIDIKIGKNWTCIKTKPVKQSNFEAGAFSCVNALGSKVVILAKCYVDKRYSGDIGSAEIFDSVDSHEGLQLVVSCGTKVKDDKPKRTRY